MRRVRALFIFADGMIQFREVDLGPQWITIVIGESVWRNERHFEWKGWASKSDADYGPYPGHEAICIFAECAATRVGKEPWVESC